MKRLWTGILLIGLLSLSAMVAAASTTTVVSPADMHSWTFAQDPSAPQLGTGSGSLVNGPGTSPLGTGSANLVVDDNGREVMANPAYAGVPLADITTLEYSTYRTAPATTTSVLAIALQFDIDYDLTDSNTDWQGRLVYEPYYNGTVVPGAWQTWDTMAGKWWASSGDGKLECPISKACSWSDILSKFPNAGIRAGAGNTLFKAGGPWAGGFDGNIDAFTIGINGNDTTYDFEALTPPPSDMNQCKNDGWQAFNNPSYRNQGACVSSVVS